MKPETEVEFREFVATRLDQLGRFAYLLCRDWHQAEDVVQRALTKLYLRWPKAAIRSPDAYVRRIIVNNLHDDRRLGWFKREHVSTRLPERSYNDPTDDHAVRVTVLEAIARLPRRQQLAVVLRHWEDMSVDQTAVIMGCSTGNVKSQTARGLLTLRDLLKDSVPTQAPGAI